MQQKVLDLTDADAQEADLTSEQRRALWMQYLRSRQGKYMKGENDKCPPEMRQKVIKDPQRYFSMWPKAKTCWGTVKLMEKKKTRSSKRARGGAQWLDYAQLVASKGKKEAEEWVKALIALAEADPDSSEDYLKPHPTLGILDPTGKNPKMKLFRVQKITDEDFTDEEEDTTERIFEGDMAEAPEDAFDEEDPPGDADAKTNNKKKPRTPEDVAKAAEEAERRKKEKADKEQAQKADLAGRAATWLHRLPADIAKSKKTFARRGEVQIT